MPRAIYLPPEEDTTVQLNFPGTEKKSVDVDILDLEALFITANDQAKEMGTRWQHQAPSILKKATGIDISVTQAVLLYGAVKAQIEDAKKKLSDPLAIYTNSDA